MNLHIIEFKFWYSFPPALYFQATCNLWFPVVSCITQDSRGVWLTFRNKSISWIKWTYINCSWGDLWLLAKLSSNEKKQSIGELQICIQGNCFVILVFTVDSWLVICHPKWSRKRVYASFIPKEERKYSYLFHSSN